MKRNYFILICSMLCLILCLGLASCGGNGGTENGGTENGGTENGGNVEDNKNYVTITFETSGGSVLESKKVEKDGKIPVPQDPTKEGYTFEGWYYGGEQWSFIRYTATDNMTLVARWVPVTYTIEYIGEVEHTNKTTYTVEEEFNLVGNCTLDYYEFSSWYLDQELTKPITKIEKGTTGNLKLYGKNEYTGIILTLNDDEYTVVDCAQSATSVVIPEEYKGLRVTTIDKTAFRDCTKLTSVTIENGVTTIGDYAFYGCESLTRVTIPNSVTKIGEAAFYGCARLTRVDISDIGAWCKIAFRDFVANPLCYAHNLYLNGELVTDLVIPNSVTKIGNYAFEASVLTRVEIPNSVTSISDNAFSGCTNIKELEAPTTALWSIPKNSLQTVIITGGEIIGEKAFDGCTSLTSIEIPNSVTKIGNYAFSGCTGLTSIEIPNSVTQIGYYAFEYCTGLTSVVIPNKVPTIGDGAFYGCTSLTSVEIPNSVTSIGWSAFSGCTGLTSIEIPNSVTSIGKSAFYGCTGLEEIILPFVGNGSDETHFGYIFGASSYSDNNSYVPTSLKKITITGGASIGNSAFRDCTGLTSIVIPNSVTSIGNSAFYGCTRLTSMEIPNSVTSIGIGAFSGCTGLTSIEIPNSVTTIGGYAFRNCTGLTSMEIPNSVTKIGDYAFNGCTGLTSVTIPNSVTTIGEYAFYGCNKLTIYCQAESKPSGWDSCWNLSNRPVEWGSNIQPKG